MAVEDIAKLREETGAGVMDAKRAFEEAGGDYNKAKEILANNADAIAKKKAERATNHGLIECYVHGGKIGVMVEIQCESDFVAKNADFKAFTHNVALQIASMNPEDVEELMVQEYIMDPKMKISDYLNSIIAQIRENIKISRFVRFELGEEK